MDPINKLKVTYFVNIFIELVSYKSIPLNYDKAGNFQRFPD